MAGLATDYTMQVEFTGGLFRTHEHDGEKCDGYLKVAMPFKSIRDAVNEPPVMAQCVRCGQELGLTKKEIADSLESIARELRDKARDLHHYARELYKEDAKGQLAAMVDEARAEGDHNMKDWMFSESYLGRVIDEIARETGDTYEREYGNLR